MHSLTNGENSTQRWSIKMIESANGAIDGKFASERVAY